MRILKNRALSRNVGFSWFHRGRESVMQDSGFFTDHRTFALGRKQSFFCYVHLILISITLAKPFRRSDGLFWAVAKKYLAHGANTAKPNQKHQVNASSRNHKSGNIADKILQC